MSHTMPSEAILVLDETDKDNVNFNEHQYRVRLRAQALITLEKYNDALLYLKDDNSEDGEIIRREALFQAKYWNKYADQIMPDFDDLVSTIENSDFKIVSGSRISRMGANITKESARKIISMTINMFIRKILSMDFKDTQCGAKIFHKDVINISFSEKFVTKWIFDVEIFKRITAYYGIEKAKSIICEQPLKRWIHADGSKLSMKDSVKIVFQLAQIAWVYRTNNKKATNNNIEFQLAIKHKTI